LWQGQSELGLQAATGQPVLLVESFLQDLHLIGRPPKSAEVAAPENVWVGPSLDQCTTAKQSAGLIYADHSEMVVASPAALLDYPGSTGV
jgi:hypothetical protein